MDEIALLKKQSVFQKLFHLFRKRYEGLGRIGGSVSLAKFSKAEIQELSGFTGISFQELQRKSSITLLQFEKSLPGTRFRDHSLLQLLEAFYGEELLNRQQQKSLQVEKDQHFIQQMKQKFSSIHWYVDWMAERTTTTSWLWRIVDEDKKEMKSLLAFIQRAFHFIHLQEGAITRLPFVAQATTGDPHGLDRSHIRGRMLLHALRVHQQYLGNEVLYSYSLEDENELLGLYGILRDDLWSFVTCQNLLAEINGVIHPVWKAACESSTVLNLPMKEVLKVTCVFPASGSTVWVLENSGVASTIMELNPTQPIICTHGQLRLAGWKLLDSLVAEGFRIQYSGDLDPEGIVIADKIKRKYGNSVSFWYMDSCTYIQGVNLLIKEGYSSDMKLAENRIDKLKSITSSELKELVDMMKQKKVAVYQESFINKLIPGIVS
ncbi:uncharacterized protein (TIGR02679 family) [Chryseomicrobium aureum]|uniref:TIGR02679 family protein n=1 Tax=Chryseomicrobium aureum TaxID=1441723 RepID=UPI00195A3670|nr:TIGR02679 family protein [Chryseomicrobium aureum]MBM7706423.1 uncharacterized protein (TIGR02679 family) [Chryseomicrobium aureum]